MRIDRLFSILVILLNKNIVTAKELAEKFEVSARTIYRDIDALASAGIPIYANRGIGGGISLLDNYTISRTMITEKDSEELLVALKALEITKYPELDTVISRLSSLFKNICVDDWIEVDFSEWGISMDIVDNFQTVKKAILNSQTLDFTYYNSYGQKTKRRAAPIKLIFKGQAWYLWALCKSKSDFRLFKLNRIKDLCAVEEYFERQELTKLDNFHYKLDESASAKKVDLRLRFEPEAIYRLYDNFNDTDLIKNPDGTYQLDVTFPEGEWVYSFLLSFGPGVEVIHPDYIKNELIKRLKENLNKYKK